MDGNRPRLIPLILLVLAVVIIATAILFCGSDTFSQSAATVVAIAKMEVGAPPADFQFARTGQGSESRWTVVSDPTSFGGQVIEQSSTDRTDYRFPLAIFNSIVAKNVDVSISFKSVAGRVDQAGGIAVRVLDADNYYVVRANALEDNVRFYRLVKGRREQIDGASSKRTANDSPLSLTAKFYSRPPIRPSTAWEKLRSGQSLTASRASTRSRLMYCPSTGSADDIQHEFLRPGPDHKRT